MRHLFLCGATALIISFAIILSSCTGEFTITGRVIATVVTGESLRTYSTEIWLESGDKFRLWGIHPLELDAIYEFRYKSTWPERNGRLLYIRKS